MREYQNNYNQKNKILQIMVCILKIFKKYIIILIGFVYIFLDGMEMLKRGKVYYSNDFLYIKV